MKFRNFTILSFLFFLLTESSIAVEPDVFVQSTVNRASKILAEEIDKSEKIIKLKEIAKETVDIKGIGLMGTSERPEIKIDWRIYTKNIDNPLIRDLIIEGLSLARTQKEEFSSILNSNDGDINALFKSLEQFSKD